MGLGPAALDIGDKVYILCQALVPFILRPEKEFFRLAGECYTYKLRDSKTIKRQDLKEGKVL